MATATTLEMIDSPQDLEEMSVSELTALAASLRARIVEVVARNGGHLATNLGNVELTLALHRVFDSPRDKLIWDVGNQCYTHKMITGRRDRFPTIRKLGGLSGFLNHTESAHDPVTTGHAGTALSAALGLATARDRLGDDFSVVASIGDGGLTVGLAYEALNNIQALHSQLLVIVNDNEYSISPSCGALPAALSRCKSRILGGGIFDELGINYLGPVDGHDIELLIDVLGEAKEQNAPVVIHAITKKGKGYGPAERDPDKYHGVGPFDVTTGQLIKGASAECH